MVSIQEANLKANLFVETSPVQTTASWTNHIDTVRDVALTRGGIEPFIGINEVEPGSGTITLVDNVATILPGYWVRIRYSSTIIWAGYVQDVNRTYSDIGGTFYEFKTLTVLDWAAYISQMTVSDLSAFSTQFQRNQEINGKVPGSPLQPISGGLPPITNIYSQLLGLYPLGQVMDLSANSTANGWWRPELVVPTGSGSISAIARTGTSIAIDDVALTDGTHTGTPNNLTYYTDIEVATKTSQVVNSIIINNITAADNEPFTVTYQKEDAASIAAYGTRLATVDANAWVNVSTRNLYDNPSFEDPTKESTDANFFYSIEQPTLDSAGSWNAFNGVYASRTFCNVAQATVANPLDERVPVVAGTLYYGFAYGGNSATANSRGRFFMQWLNESGAAISITYGAYVNFINNRQWYQCTLSQTAPAGAVYCRIGIQHSRSTGANFPVGSKSWTDAMYFGTSNETTFWDGNTPDTSSLLYGWVGPENASQSFKATNSIDTLATQFLTDNAVAKYSPYRIRVNAQANLTAVQLFNLYESVYVWFKANRWTAPITGITHTIRINEDGTTRWMIDLDVRPSTATI